MPRAKRGEIWLVDLGLVQKMRPCLILSIDYLDHERAVVTYVPRTTRLRNTRFEVTHNATGFEAGAFDAQGIGSIPDVKLERRLIAADGRLMREVETAVKRWLEL